MSMFGMVKALNALNSDDISDLVEYATDYLSDLPDEKILAESFQQTIAAAENLLTFMKQRLKNAETRNRNLSDDAQAASHRTESRS